MNICKVLALAFGMLTVAGCTSEKEVQDAIKELIDNCKDGTAKIQMSVSHFGGGAVMVECAWQVKDGKMVGGVVEPRRPIRTPGHE